LEAVLRGPSRTGIQRIEREDEPRRVSLEVMLGGTCDRTRLLDLLENFTLFSEHKAGLVNIFEQIHQFLGVNNAIATMMRVRPTVGGTSYTSPTFHELRRVELQTRYWGLV
jgi:hypothetical protein